jgi:hypothetical protein
MVQGLRKRTISTAGTIADNSWRAFKEIGEI